MCSRTMWSVAGQPVLIGRNMDWTSEQRNKLHVMPRGIEMNGMVPENPLKWTSKYGSVAVSTYDCCTLDGLNEAGLGVSSLYLAEATYGERDPSIPGLCSSVHVQYYLDNFATVAEAVAASNSFQVQPMLMVHQGYEAKSPLHVTVADKSGDSAIFEIFDGEVSIHHGKDVTVATNSPPYEEQLKYLKQFKGLGGDKPLPGSFEANDRFVRGAYYVKQLPNPSKSYESAVAGILSVMRSQATPLGANDPVRPNVAATIYQSVADLTNLRYYHNVTDMPNVVWIDLKNQNLEEGAPIKTFDLYEDREAAGEVSGKFHPSPPIAWQMAGTKIPM